jgi:hypothetical protein
VKTQEFVSQNTLLDPIDRTNGFCRLTSPLRELVWTPDLSAIAGDAFVVRSGADWMGYGGQSRQKGCREESGGKFWKRGIPSGKTRQIAGSHGKSINLRFGLGEQKRARKRKRRKWQELVGEIFWACLVHGCSGDRDPMLCRRASHGSFHGSII